MEPVKERVLLGQWNAMFWIAVLAIGWQNASALSPCGQREACRVVEYHPKISEDTSAIQALELENSGVNAPIAEVDYGDGLENEVPTEFPFEESSYTIESHQVCDCPTGFECPDENSTDSERSVRLDTFVELKLCIPKIRYPICRDFRRPVVRVFKEITEDHEQPQNNQSPTINRMKVVKATMWCRCESGRFGKSRNIEVWMNGRQHAWPYMCSRNRQR